MKHVAVFYQTQHGRAGCVMSGPTFDVIEHSLSASVRAHKAKDGLGLVGYQGADDFQDAVRIASEWEHFYPMEGTVSR